VSAESYNWMDLKRAAAYSCLSVRTLRSYLRHAVYPLPARLVGRKWLIHRAALDAWLRRFPAADEDIDQIVDEIIEEIRRPVRSRTKET
jgi:hypothetical protein